jgi:arsenate reductase
VSTEVTIYHNPDCGTSRNTLALIRNASGEPMVVEYLKTPPSRTALQDLIRRMGIPVRIAQGKGNALQGARVGQSALKDEQLIDAMMEHPILINRPIVVTPWGVKLCRRRKRCWISFRCSRKVRSPNGEAVIDAAGRRLV